MKTTFENLHEFVCPKCGGKHFGRNTAEINGTVQCLPTVRCQYTQGRKNWTRPAAVAAPVKVEVEHVASEPVTVPVTLGKTVELYPCDFWPLVRQVVQARGATEAFPLALGNVDFWMDGETCAYSIPANTWSIDRVANDLTRYMLAPKAATEPANFACY